MVTTPTKARTDPTDKSIPPESITTVIPNATIPIMDTCIKIFNWLFTSKNLGFMIEAAINIIKNAMMTLYSDHNHASLSLLLVDFLSCCVGFNSVLANCLGLPFRASCITHNFVFSSIFPFEPSCYFSSVHDINIMANF